MSFAYCPLFSGSSGNAAILSTPQARFLIDAGLAGKTMAEALARIGVDPHTLDGIIITHEHTDHVRGAGVFSRKYNLPIYANAKTWLAMQTSVGNIAPQNVRVFDTNHDFFIGDCHIFPFSIPHDAADPVGFTFFHQGKKISQITDLGHVPAPIFDIVSDSSLILLESNHDITKLEHSTRPASLKRRIRSNHGHLSNDTAAETCLSLIDRGCRRFILGHMSRESNTPEIAYQTTQQFLGEHGLQIKQDIELYLAYRDHPCGIFRL